MKVFQGPLILLNVISPKTISTKENINVALEFSKHFNYQDDFYQIGPDVLSIMPQDGEPNYVEYQFFLSLNLPPEVPKDVENLKSYEKYVIENALITRVADNKENYFGYDKQLRTYASKHFNLDLSPKTYFVITDNLGEKVIDVYIPIEGGNLD